MLKILPLLLLCGCATNYHPQPSDTAFDESKRDWIAVFEHEIEVAIENGDGDAYHFFMQELIQEKIRRYKEQQNNP